MPDPIAELLDSTRLLFDLQQGNEIAQGFSGCLDPEEIAAWVTRGLVEKFNCAFARIWLLEPDQKTLRLVASSGMYTHVNGFFAKIPMGAYKVGKIAQNRVSFLSNNLADEPWVGNREWAIANNIRGFAGYPLAIKGRVVGVLATFSYHTMAPEFLEVLQTLCTMVTVALDAALQHQKEKESWQSSAQSLSFNYLSLSDQIASILASARLTLVGTEQPLSLPLIHVFLQTAEILNQLKCAYCRLIYTAESVALEAIVPAPDLNTEEPKEWVRSVLGDLFFTTACLGGTLHTQIESNQRAIQILLKIPYPHSALGARLQIRCSSPGLQLAFTHLAFLAGLRVCDTADDEVPLLTDDLVQCQAAKRGIWINQKKQAVPKGIKAQIDLSVSPEQLRQAIGAASQGKSWGIDAATVQQLLSDRELEIMALLAQGLRDRDIASQLMISESTVKFHMNNTLTKLKARTRYQALHQVMVNGWIG
ncbi:LuxR C-terminal-related transcriptional regulator [Leptolyngbya sp. FACHB-261]|uniref:LuxR C-terminal-related transcriptional regulator n=1 Tax=Leptolyngbya sp. FACHB-261 TaxID=2692806 RepID=UPI00168593BF|nr:LuxR C-terminal-related transcriptional regulator [Leptolyngbya sp. FACHB-261]MBD2100438.1 GAF domain-containing protein [Leptolyngbya sp. FACHB-261]